MPNKFHFFTDFDLLSAQTASQAYGPAGNNGTDDEYRVTSLHQTNAQAKAYAVCDGIICAQVDANNSNLLNIILKPMQQPPLNFVPIKYYIYKGIEKSSLINGAVIDYTSTLKVVQSIKESQDAFNISYDKANNNPVGTTQTIASSNALGIQYTATAASPDTVLDTDSIDVLFYKESDYQLPLVRAGWSIGLFNTTLLGFEVILDSIYYEPILERARYFDGAGAKHTIKVPQLQSTPTQAETFEHWHDKEVILNFMDPAAFYGSMYGITIEATNSSSTKGKKSGNELYDDLLTTFYNRNRTYIDIRNERNHSIDYYNNYGRDIQIAFDDTSSLQTISYYRADWPILIVENNALPTSSTDESVNYFISLPIGDNEYPLTYIVQGYNDKYPNEIKSDAKYIKVEKDSNSNFSLKLPFAVSNYAQSGTTRQVASLVKFIYLRRKNPFYFGNYSETGVQILNNWGLNNFFLLLENNPLWKTSSTTQCKTYNESIFIETSDLDNQIYMAQIGIALDKNGDVSLYSYPVDKYYSSYFAKKILPQVLSKRYDNFDTFIEGLASDFQLDILTLDITDGGNSSEFVCFTNNLKVLESNTSNQTLDSISINDILIFKFSSANYTSLTTIAQNSFLPSKKVTIGFDIIGYLPDDTNATYVAKYEILLSGYTLDTSTGVISITTINTGVFGYTIMPSPQDLSIHSILS